MRAFAAVMAIAVTVLVSCSPTDPTPDPRDIVDKIDTGGIPLHLRRLQDIANANQGNRAEGTPGYDASVEYVATTLKDQGFDVQTPEFERLDRVEGGNPTLTVAGRSFHVDQASLLVTTPQGGLNAITLRPQKSPGCSEADYGTVSVRNAIVVVDDTACSVGAKQNVAIAKGAVGMLIVGRPGPTGPAGLFTPGYYRQLTVPVAVIDTETDAALRDTNGSVRLVLDSQPIMVKSRNVVAQTKSGDTKNVVVVGAHLDSSARSPGMNDNASGVAALLVVAEALGAEPKSANAVRFTFWGSESEAPTKYVSGLARDQLDDIAMYLSADILGSRNAGYFTFDGDQSAQPNPDIPAQAVPAGSGGIERTLAGYLNLAGERPADMPLSRVTDYGPFLAAGIPVGGLTTGSLQRKTEVQARLWGGQAGALFDGNNHTARDTILNIDGRELTLMAQTLAFAVGTYAQSVEGVNGVPPRDQRHRSTP